MKYLGRGEEFRVRPVTGAAWVYACLPYRVTSVEIAAASARPGEVIRGTISVQAEPVPKQAEEHVFHLTVTDPNGKLREEHTANLAAPEGKIAFALPLALDDPRGTWILRARDAVSGIIGERKVEVQ